MLQSFPRLLATVTLNPFLHALWQVLAYIEGFKWSTNINQKKKEGICGFEGREAGGGGSVVLSKGKDLQERQVMRNARGVGRGWSEERRRRSVVPKRGIRARAARILRASTNRLSLQNTEPYNDTECNVPV